MSEALKESNLKVAMLTRQLEETDQLMQAGQENGKDSNVQVRGDEMRVWGKDGRREGG